MPASGFFVLRTPLLPFADFAAAADEDALRTLVRRPEVREAIFVASPSLDGAIDGWLAETGGTRPPGVAAAVLRYVARMASRPTPFGLFAGCTLGRLGAQGERTSLALAPLAAYRRHTRLDMLYLAALAEAFDQDPEIGASVQLRPSSGLFPSAGQLRYPEARADAQTRDRSFHLVSVEMSPHLEATLARASGGATAHELAAELAASMAHEGVTIEDARVFVSELVRAQVLVSDVMPRLTGDEPLDGTIDALGAAANAPAAARARATLDVTRSSLRALDAEPLGVESSRYRAISDGLSTLPARGELARLFQVDMYKPASSAVLAPSIARELERGAMLLARLRGAREHPDLRTFREMFDERWGEEEVPLMLALDDERGIGFKRGERSAEDPSPLLAGLAFPPSEAVEQPHRLDGRLIARAAALTREGATEWSLTATEIEDLASKDAAPLPAAFAVMATLAARGAEALARGEVRALLHAVSGPSGAVLFGRFCHGDAALRDAVRAHLRDEEAQRPEAVHAEVVHLPEGRLGNILCRPLLRAHEIPYLGRSGASTDAQIPLTDLRVTVRRGRIVLRSHRLNREIVPRLTAAHAFERADLGAYRFLCALQSSGVASGGWSWGAYASHLPFLPRVTHGRLVLSLARWTVARNDLAELRAAKGSDGLRKAAAALRQRTRMPRWVCLVDGDNVLPVDLASDMHLASLAAARVPDDRAPMRFVELWPSPDELCVTGPEGVFAQEIVVPFVSHGEVPEARPRRGGDDSRPLARRFAPGSEWLFAKLYGGNATADHLLVDVVGPLVEQAIAAGDADGWFFLRYSDPLPHLRVRLHGAPDALAARVLPRLHAATAAFLADGRLSKVELATYVREVERYGGVESIALAEEVFRIDSDAVLTIIGALPGGDEGADLRWRATLLGVHAMLVDLGFDLPGRLALTRAMRADFAAEHRVDSALEHTLATRFRAMSGELDGLLGEFAPGGRDGNGDAPLSRCAEICAEILAERSTALAGPLGQLRALSARGALAGTIDTIARSHVHMHVNRMTRGAARTHELVIYDLLARHYARACGRSFHGRQ